jgi:hypothetical protein
LAAGRCYAGETPAGSGSRSGVLTTVTLHSAWATTWDDTLPRYRRNVELPRDPMMTYSTRLARANSRMAAAGSGASRT